MLALPALERSRRHRLSREHDLDWFRQLLHVGSKGWDRIGYALIRTTWRQASRFHRSLFQCSQHWSLRQIVQVGQRDKAVLGADRFNPPLLPQAEHSCRESVEIAEDPNQVKSLHEGRVYIARAKRCEYPQHSGEECLHPHDQSTRDVLYLMFRSLCFGPEQSKGQHYCTKCEAKGSENWIFLLFFYRLWMEAAFALITVHLRVMRPLVYCQGRSKVMRGLA